MTHEGQRWVLRGSKGSGRPIVVDGPALGPDHEVVVLSGASRQSQPAQAHASRSETSGLREALMFIYSSGASALGIWRALVEEIARREQTTPTQVTNEINRAIAAGAAGPAPALDDTTGR